MAVGLYVSRLRYGWPLSLWLRVRAPDEMLSWLLTRADLGAWIELHEANDD